MWEIRDFLLLDKHPGISTTHIVKGVSSNGWWGVGLVGFYEPLAATLNGE